jgi:phage shock protein A
MENLQEVKRQLEDKLDFQKGSLEKNMGNFSEKIVELGQTIKRITENKNNEDYHKKVSSVIHEINWTWANMNLDGLINRIGEYKETESMIKIIDKLIERK